MTQYTLRRFLQSLLFIFLAWLAVYSVLVYIMPQGPKAMYEGEMERLTAQLQEEAQATPTPLPQVPGALGQQGEDLTPEEHIRALTEVYDKRYGLGKPWPLSFFAWLFDPTDTSEVIVGENGEEEVSKGLDFMLMGWHIRGSGMLTGDFGRTEPSSRVSIGREQLVSEILGSRLGNTIALVGLSFLLALLLALPIGLLAANRRNTGVDHALSLVSFVSISLPPFTLATLLVVLMGVLPFQVHNKPGWEWFPYMPAAGVAEPDFYGDPFNRLYHLVLPVLTLALPQMAWLSRHLRFSTLDVLRKDFVRTARAKGLSRTRVMAKHVLKNALIPMITVVALALPVFISGATMVETVFGYTGLGQVYFRALGGCLATGPAAEFFCPPDQRLLPMDHPTALTLTFLIIVVVAFANMAADILYAVADPRINYETKARS
jgi:peptide/nickel transport system permease protein